MLTIEHLTKSFGNLCAVNDLSLTVPTGKMIGLIGPNGSGKSTLLSLLGGQQRADQGRIYFAGEEITSLPSDVRFQRGLVRSYQEPSIFLRMTVLDNMLLPVKGQQGERPWIAPFHRRWQRQEQAASQQAATELEQLRLRPHFAKPASDLSGGQMKLLELGRSLLGQPKLLLLDEPTAGVAPALAHTIFQQIDHLCRTQGLTFLIVEHRLELLFDFVDSLYVMHLGGLIAQGTPAEISQDAFVREVYFGE
ncbi:MAG: ABC transporter ATP-binding protein [Caldilineaceae bacterium]|nr:ABC transporter ATP-binding protein [Caldilineaceae bacterium]